MATDLTLEARAGYEARMNAGRCLEQGEPANPHMPTSRAWDAWEAGYAHACNTLAGLSTGGIDKLKATAGRGDRVNIINTHGKHSYRLNYWKRAAGAGCAAYLEA